MEISNVKLVNHDVSEGPPRSEHLRLAQPYRGLSPEQKSILVKDLMSMQ